jgi:hypothetical protein
MYPTFRIRFAALAVVHAVVFSLAACEGVKTEGVYPDRRQGDSTPYGNVERRGSVFGEGGLAIGGADGGAGEGGPGGGGGVAVNSYLWRASLDTIAFMPVSSADPFGGVIITDWHSLPETPRERFKMNVYILGRALRADGVRVSVFRQVQDASGGWQDAPTPQDTGIQVEDAILTRARQLRYDVMQQ